MFVLYNQDNIITALSKVEIQSEGFSLMKIDGEINPLFLGKNIHQLKIKTPKEMRVAFICNWSERCGISTYSKYLANAITSQVKEVKIFSETSENPTDIDDERILRCWKRGETPTKLCQEILKWNPDFIIIQHEFGIFPKATYFLQLLTAIQNIPYVVTCHSVYEHLDKVICTSAMKSIVVHTKKCQEILKGLGHNQKIFVVPHGCVEYENVEELYNIFQNPYTIIQFGFGFQYKGVDVAIEAINHLKKTDPKFKDIFYCYLLSSSGYFNNVHNNYLKFLNDKINKLSLHDNVAIVQGYHSDNVINSYLRTAKIAIFPYIADKKHRVYGASGAIRIAMANNIPVIASSACNQFDDLEGVLPRPANYLEIAKEIDEIFSNSGYRNSILKKQKEYISENNWYVSATRYLTLYRELLK